MKIRASVGILCVLVLASLPMNNSGGDGDPVAYLVVSVDDAMYRTWDHVTIRLESFLPVNESGNWTWVPNESRITLSVYDLNNDVVVQELSVPLMNGSIDVDVFVLPEWTTTQIEVTAIDYEHDLVARASFRTEMSDTYLLWVLRSDIHNQFVEFAQDERAKTDAAIQQDRIMSGLIVSMSIFGVVVMALRRDHRLSRRVASVSVWGRFSRKSFPYASVYDEMDVFLDPERTWAPEAAAAYGKWKQEAHVRKLEEQKADIDKEIEGVRTGRVS